MEIDWEKIKENTAEHPRKPKSSRGVAEGSGFLGCSAVFSLSFRGTVVLLFPVLISCSQGASPFLHALLSPLSHFPPVYTNFLILVIQQVFISLSVSTYPQSSRFRHITNGIPAIRSDFLVFPEKRTMFSSHETVVMLFSGSWTPQREDFEHLDPKKPLFRALLAS